MPTKACSTMPAAPRSLLAMVNENINMQLEWQTVLFPKYLYFILLANIASTCPLSTILLEM